MTDLTILKLLDNRPMYGAEMIEEIKRLSGNAVVLSLPTLYSSLHRMATKKLVNSYWREAAIGGRCHVYNITSTGREYLAKNPIKIDYSLLIDNPVIANKTFSTIEEAFSLPLSKNSMPPKLPDDTRVLTLPTATVTETMAAVPNVPLTTVTPIQTALTSTPEPTNSNAPTTEKIPNKKKIAPYIEPTDQIASTMQIKHKQMSINMAGTLGNNELRPFIDLNAVTVGNDFVIINRLRIFAVLITAGIFLFVNLLCSWTHSVQKEYYLLVYIGLLVYLAINVAIYLVFPRLKSMFNRHQSFWHHLLVTILLVIFTVFLCISKDTGSLLWLLLFAFAPIVELILMVCLRKRRIFKC